MECLKFVILMLATSCMKTTFAQTNCELKYDVGKISDTRTVNRYNKYTKCWEIKVPAEKNAIIDVTKLTLDRTQYADVYLKVGDRTLRPQLSNSKAILMKDSTVTFNVENIRNGLPITASFELNYKVRSLACDDPNPFKCNETECVPMSQRCNGAKDCTNGADEEGCVQSTSSTVGSSSNVESSTNGESSSNGESSTKVTTEAGVSTDVDNGGDAKTSRDKALQLLKNKQSIKGGWGKYSPEAIIAIHLAYGTNFDEDCEGKINAKHAELQIAAAEIQNAASPSNIENGDRATFINALLAICEDPDDFFGIEFVTELESSLSNPPSPEINIAKGSTFLALCNAGSTALEPHISKILQLIERGNDDVDENYYGILTIACMKRKALVDVTTNQFQDAEKDVRRVMSALLKLQKADGSMSSNVVLTAKIVQAWTASGIIGNRRNYQKAIEYLMKEIDKSPTEYDILLYTLPVFGNRTLGDVRCKENDKKARDNVESTKSKKPFHGNQMSEQKTIMKMMLQKEKRF